LGENHSIDATVQLNPAADRLLEDDYDPSGNES
jgi:hypothetical protein